MTQIEAFPLKIFSFHYFRSKSTAHAIGRALAEDNRYYIVKRNTESERLVCATEWIGIAVASSLMLPTAPTKVLQLDNGDLVLGSQEISPRLSDIEVSRMLTATGGANDLFIPNLTEVTSSTYALDLALGNGDRHESNFVISANSVDDSSQRYGTISLIDFSSADILSSDKSPIPFARGSNTTRAGRLMRAVHGFASDAACDTISLLRRERSYIADRAIWCMPREWLSDSQRDELKSWMLGSPFAERLERIEIGLENGSYL